MSASLQARSFTRLGLVSSTLGAAKLQRIRGLEGLGFSNQGVVIKVADTGHIIV